MIAYTDMLRWAIEVKMVSEAVKKLVDLGANREWIKHTLLELGFKEEDAAETTKQEE